LFGLVRLTFVCRRWRHLSFMPLRHDARNDVLLCWIGPTNCQPNWLRTRSAEIRHEEKYFDCWSYHAARWIVNEMMWKTIPKLPKSVFENQTVETELSVFEFWGWFSSVFRKPTSDIFIGFCTPLSTTISSTAGFPKLAFSGKQVSRFAGQNSSIGFALLCVKVHLTLRDLRQLLCLDRHLLSNHNLQMTSIRINYRFRPVVYKCVHILWQLSVINYQPYMETIMIFCAADVVYDYSHYTDIGYFGMSFCKWTLTCAAFMELPARICPRQQFSGCI